MFPSRDQTEARLVELRRERDRIEREIADLLLYLELGRRLAETASSAGSGSVSSEPVTELPHAGRSGTHSPIRGTADAVETRPVVQRFEEAASPKPSGAFAERTPHPSPETHATHVPAVAFEDDPVAARRYGRAILDQALDSLREAGRPLHAGEILERIVQRGFTVPGHDPVAALNTRLWKRSGPGGPLRRLGDAVYALAEPPAA